MFRKLLKNKKAQNVVEYALLIALVVAAVVAMQTYAQRALQAKIAATAGWMTGQTATDMTIGNQAQYEPYYLQSDYTVTASDSDTQILVSNRTRQEVFSNRTRGIGGFQVYTYDNAKFGEQF